MLQLITKIISRKEIRFLAVGGLLFVIDYITSVSVFYLFNAPAGLASAIGFLVSFIFGFLLNRHVVFIHSSQSYYSVHTQVALYLILAVCNLFISATIVQLVDVAGIRITISKPVVTAIIAIWNYIILGKFIFKKKE